MNKLRQLACIATSLLTFTATTQEKERMVSLAWSPDNGDGTFQNPIIHADYSDPDICKAGSDFFMTASSFNAIPALPILHSTDLVNWKLINHAVPEFPGSYFDVPQHGNGVWAPCFRFYEGTFYIYWGDPDRGIYMVYTDDPAGEWSAPVLVKKAYGNIDPSPLWDDDGKVYMVHAFAHSRAGVKSLLQVVELSADGSQTLDKGTIVFDGHKDHPTIEGPKFYKRNDYYYIFAPAGGVPTGWQLVLRSRNVYGPYEEKIVLAQGNTPINGPHQGGWVALDNGEDWFIHFQDKEAYGRIVHLQPVKWIDDWPVMGNDPDGNGTGEPVLSHKKPNLPVGKVVTPADTDEFDKSKPGLQWQWNAKPQRGWYRMDAQNGMLQLNSLPIPETARNLWLTPNLLLQKFPAETFTATVKLHAQNLKDQEEAGLLIFGLDYASLVIKSMNGKLTIQQRNCMNADKNTSETLVASTFSEGTWVLLQTRVTREGNCSFFYSTNGEEFMPIGKPFRAREGKWVGAKIGLYAKKTEETGIGGSALIDWFRIRQ